MFLCPKCDNLFDITQEPTQKGGADFYEELINKILTKKPITSDDIKKIQFDKFNKHRAYTKLTSKNKNLVFNTIQDMLPKKSKKIMKTIIDDRKHQRDAYFSCPNCGYTEKIKPDTLIYKKSSHKNITSGYTDQFDMIWSPIIPRTSNYMCLNKKCESHTQPEKRAAVFYRLGDTYNLKYICLVCRTVF